MNGKPIITAVRLPVKMREKLERIANRNHRTLSQQLRYMIEKAVK